MLNSHTVQITGLSEVEQPLEIGHEYLVQVVAECNSITKLNNEDGSFTFKHKLKQKTVEIKDDGGKVIKVKDNKTDSQKLRGQIILEAFAKVAMTSEEADTYYKVKMAQLRRFWPQVSEYLNALDEERIK